MQGDWWQLHWLWSSMKSCCLSIDKTVKAASFWSQCEPPWINGISWKIAAPFLISFLAKTPRPLPRDGLISQSRPGAPSGNAKVSNWKRISCSIQMEEVLTVWTEATLFTGFASVGEGVNKLLVLEQVNGGDELPLTSWSTPLLFKLIVLIFDKRSASSDFFWLSSALRFLVFSFLRRLRSALEDGGEAGGVSWRCGVDAFSVMASSYNDSIRPSFEFWDRWAACLELGLQTWTLQSVHLQHDVGVHLRADLNSMVLLLRW